MWILGLKGLNICRTLSGPQRKCKGLLFPGTQKTVCNNEVFVSSKCPLSLAFTVIISSLQ